MERKYFDLEKRTTEFDKDIVGICRRMPKDSINNRITGQLVGSAGSIGANYREANDSLGEKDFVHRLRIARKESKEAIHWLELLAEANPSERHKIDVHIKEADEIKRILSTIISKST